MSNIITIQKINLDYHRNAYISVTANQYDTGQILYIGVFDNGQSVDISDVTEVKSRIKTPDLRYLLLSNSNGYVSIQDNKVVIKLPQAVFLSAGKAIGEVVLYRGTTQLSTMNFNIQIAEGAYDENEILSDPEQLSVLDEWVRKVIGYTNNAKQSADSAASSATSADSSAKLSKAWAVGTSSTTTPSDTNNSKHYYDLVNGMLDTKADKSVVNKCAKNVDYNNKNGCITITYVDDTTKVIDTDLEKVAVNFNYDQANEKLILTLEDGTIQEIDLSAFISEYDFNDSSTIQFTMESREGSDKTITAIVKPGSITETELQVNYLTDIKSEVALSKQYMDSAELSKNSALQSASSASSSEQNAANSSESARQSKEISKTNMDNSKYYADLAQSYSDGTGDSERSGKETDNAKYYMEQTEALKTLVDSSISDSSISAFFIDEYGNLCVTQGEVSELTYSLNDYGELEVEINE